MKKVDFKDGRVRLPAYVKPELRNRLKVLAAQSNTPLQEFIEVHLEAVAAREEAKKTSSGRARS
jgi:hypothetical protein